MCHEDHRARVRVQPWPCRLGGGSVHERGRTTAPNQRDGFACSPRDRCERFDAGQLLFWRFWQGVFTPGIFAVTIAYVNEEWESGAGAAVASYVTGTVIGGFSGRIVAAVVAAHSSWRWAFVVLGVLNALGALAIWRWLPPGRRFSPAGRGTSTLRPMLRHLRNSQHCRMSRPVFQNLSRK